MKDNQTYREDEGSASDSWGNGQVKQNGGDLSPVDGSDGFIGANTGAAMGMKMITGKNGSVTSRPIWSERSSGADQGQAAEPISFGGQDSTDEMAPYKKVQTDEGLPQTYRTSKGAGDAGTSDSDEPDSAGGVFGKGETNQGNPDTQNHPSPTDGDAKFSDMPQTEFTHNDGGGAPYFKR